MEGISQEAIALAGHLKLNKLIVLFDDNGISIDGPLALAELGDQVKRFEAAGWAATRIDGHDPAAIAAALAAARTSDRPSLIACRTIIGFGAPTKAAPRRPTARRSAPRRSPRPRQKLGWTSPPFEIPERSARSGARPASAAGRRGAPGRSALAVDPRQPRRIRAPPARRAPAARCSPPPCTTVKQKARRRRRKTSRPAPRPSSRSRRSRRALPEMIGGSADLTGSNNTRAKGMKALSAADYAGRFIHYGVREHAMAAAMNGMALHGGIIPYSGTFLVFSDYCRPAIRLAALMGQRVIHVMTHDSIGLGEDGPTHQPVEHLAALRAIPNLQVFRPGDAVETVECWELALAPKPGRVRSRSRAKTCRSCVAVSTRITAAPPALMK